MPSRPPEVDVAVIGGGPAGLAAAAAAAEEGASVRLIERSEDLGGILNQCIHDGFGLHAFGEALSGPEFAHRYIARVLAAGVEVETDTMVAQFDRSREIVLTTRGTRQAMSARAVVLAMGCRERTPGMILMPGQRPAGVYTAGVAQWLVNEANLLVGRTAVILGSGDVGLIMARRLTWEGARVLAVLEKLPYHSGLARNVQQCLVDHGIPLYLSHTVSRIDGADRVERVAVAQVDEAGCPIPESEFTLACDTLLCSIGLIPENELSRQAGIALDPITGGARVNEQLMTSAPGVFACGNVLHIHDVADWAAAEGERAGRNAARYAAGEPIGSESPVAVRAGKGIRYVLPQLIPCSSDGLDLSLRVDRPARGVRIAVRADSRTVHDVSRTRVHPAEMVRIALPRLTLSPGVSIEVSLQ